MLANDVTRSLSKHYLNFKTVYKGFHASRLPTDNYLFT